VLSLNYFTNHGKYCFQCTTENMASCFHTKVRSLAPAQVCCQEAHEGAGVSRSPDRDNKFVAAHLVLSGFGKKTVYSYDPLDAASVSQLSKRTSAKRSSLKERCCSFVGLLGQNKGAHYLIPIAKRFPEIPVIAIRPQGLLRQS